MFYPPGNLETPDTVDITRQKAGMAVTTSPSKKSGVMKVMHKALDSNDGKWLVTTCAKTYQTGSDRLQSGQTVKIRKEK